VGEKDWGECPQAKKKFLNIACKGGGKDRVKNDRSVNKRSKGEGGKDQEIVRRCVHFWRERLKRNEH